MNGQAYNRRYGKVAVLMGGRSAERETISTAAAGLHTSPRPPAG